MTRLTKLQNRIAQTREKRERGAVLVLTALVMLLLLFIAAFATDLGAWYRQGQEQQRAADVGALNGIQAYDTAVKEYFEDLGVTGWNSAGLTPDQLRAAEEEGLRAAANTIIALMETSGLVFTDIGSGLLADDPRNVTSTSTWTITATDGTEVVITRSFIDAGLDSDGNIVYARSIDVQVVAPGEQYFSNIIRDAPEIERSASSTLSNCGAVCDTQIPIEPPFAGFNASGRGDGFGPLLFNKDGNRFNGYEEIWAVNHHVKNVGGLQLPGDIICMEAATQEPCTDASQFNLDVLYRDLQTANRPVEYIDEERGLILFVARDAGLRRSGIACFDARDREFCDTAFLPLFDATSDPDGEGFVNLVGPFVNSARTEAYVFAVDGRWACATLNNNGRMMASCGSGDSPANAGGAVMPDLNMSQPLISHGEQIGEQVYMRMPAGNGQQRFFCVTLTTGLPSCPNWGGATSLTWDYGGHNEITTLAYSTTGVPYAICSVLLGPDRHKCVRLDNGNEITTDIPNLNRLIRRSSSSWSGDAFAWHEPGTNRVLTIFAGGSRNKIGCYDWAARDHCDGTSNGTLRTNHAFHGLTQADGSDLDYIYPYAFAQISRECLIGLSHNSGFFSLNPATLEACVDTQVSAQITPCQCANDDEIRWGMLNLPESLLADTTRLRATVSATEFGPAIAGLNEVDLIATNGVLDLSAIQEGDTVETVMRDGVMLPVAYIRLSVDAVLVDGKPAWDDTRYVELEIVVQPTLVN